jgi:hypothetical protein
VVLIDALVESRTELEVSELNSSAGMNMENIGRILRNKLPHSIVPGAAAVLFNSFDLSIEESNPASLSNTTANLAATREVTSGSLEEVMARRHDEEVNEAIRQSQSQSQSQSSQPEESMGRDETGPATDVSTATLSLATDQPDEKLLALQVEAVKEALHSMLYNWKASFPRPDTRVWPIDFDNQEIQSVKGYIRKWAREKTNRINLTSSTQSDTKANECATAMLADDDFPVDDAKVEGVIVGVFREVCRRIYNQQLKNERATGKSGKGKKRARDVEEEEEEEGYRDSADSEDAEMDEVQAGEAGGPTERVLEARRAKKGKSKATEDAGKAQFLEEEGPFTECMACFFGGKTCELRHLGDTEEMCKDCRNEEVACRVLCAECAMVASDAGRGSGKEGAGFLLEECPLCDVRYV